jgi:hypothetical protein
MVNLNAFRRSTSQAPISMHREHLIPQNTVGISLVLSPSALLILVALVPVRPRPLPTTLVVAISVSLDVGPHVLTYLLRVAPLGTVNPSRCGSALTRAVVDRLEVIPPFGELHTACPAYHGNAMRGHR